MQIASIVKTGILLLCSTSCVPRSYNNTSQSENNSIKKNGDTIVYVDTHDAYQQAYNPMAPDTPLSSEALKAHAKYFTNQRKTISLTFDCAWIDAKNAYDILDALKRANIKSTFFIAGPFIFRNRYA